jgi:predicted flap endonuclease-1-like 5' DNA nuclease
VIWHFFEVWLLLFGAFAVGCGFGAALYAGLGNSRLAGVQGAFADRIGDLIDGIKTRFGFGPDWRDGALVPIERPMRERAIRRQDREPHDRDTRAIESPVSLHPTGGEDAPADGYWQEEDDWREEAEGQWDRNAVYDDAAMEQTFNGTDSRTASPAEAPPQAEDDLVAKRPAGLAAPRNGVPDHLQRIRGIGKGNEELLNSLGIFHFGQIAAWTPAEVRWVAARLPFPERIERDDWVGQATILASGGDTGYVKSADRRRARRAAGEEGDEESAE